MPYAVLFPGQGSQSVGMGADLFASRPDLLGESADEVLGWSLADVCANGPEEELTRTDRAQPALYAIAYALWEALDAAVDVPPAAAAGHSLGEYTALAAAGVLEYHQGLRLVTARGTAMDSAASSERGSMAAMLGADAERAESVAERRREEGGRLWVANLNAPGQIVMSGSIEDIEWLMANARELGVGRARPLKVAGAFHSPMMAGAAEQLSAALRSATFRPGRFQVWSNVTARPESNPRSALADQLTGPVLFASSLESMSAAGVDTFVHIGPGDVTAGMARRSVPDSSVLVLSELADVDRVATSVAVQ